MSATGDPNRVSPRVRYTARQQDGGWIVVRQVRRDGRWWSQLHRQLAAHDGRVAWETAAHLATRERERRVA